VRREARGRDGVGRIQGVGDLTLEPAALEAPVVSSVEETSGFSSKSNAVRVKKDAPKQEPYLLVGRTKG